MFIKEHLSMKPFYKNSFTSSLICTSPSSGPSNPEYDSLKGFVERDIILTFSGSFRSE